MANSEHNWKCLELVCKKIGLKPYWNFEDSMVFYNVKDEKQLTCNKSNRYLEKEFENILRQIDLSAEKYHTYVEKCKQKLPPTK